MQTRAQRLEQMRKAQRRYRAKYPDRVREAKRNSYHRRAYGITIQEKWDLLDKQGGRCACCRTSEPGRNGWYVDHDHKTKRVRGILCGHCNSALGFARDDPITLRRLIDYLESHREPT